MILQWLNNGWFNAGSNVLSYVTLSGIVSLLWSAWHHRCRGTTLCIRPGQVPIKGTTFKVCPKHSTPHHHAKLRLLHADRHAGRIGHGEIV